MIAGVTLTPVKVPAPRLDLSWLGSPRVESNGAPVRLETKKNLALLAFLSLNDRPVSRERLASIFWPDFDPERAPANLRRSLASLHASLPGKWLAADRDTVAVLPDHGIRVDVRAAGAHAAAVKAHGHDDGQPCAECRARLEEAAGLFHGEFMEGFTLAGCPEFDDWQLARRENLRAELAWTLERLARAWAAEASWEQALSAARRWLALDRLHEPAQALLVRLLALSGQRSGAIRQYEEFAQMLRDELGQEPEEETRALYNRVLARTLGPALPAAAPSVAAPEDGGATARGAPARPAVVARGLLRTKLTVPPPRGGRVPRTRLIGMVEEGLASGLLVVSAPAGFGKSTMLSEWASRAEEPVAWVSLDGGDNDLQKFLSYLAGACAGARDGVGQDAAEMLRAMPPAPAEVIVTSLINDIESTGKPLALVLDDYQFIQAQEVHAAVRLLVDRKPATLRLAIATREDPPLAMARLRSQERLGEVRADDLRFTLAEARQFLTRAMSLALTDGQVETLEKRTEGWIAGLQMAALSLQGRADVDAFLASFGGTHRYVLDYLAEEVFSRQSPGYKRFLLETSILGRMSAELCAAVTGQQGTQETLEQLERANLFVVPLDDCRSWYRYHHLFADLLRHRLERERSAEDVRTLHLKAGDWFAGHGETAEAIQEYMAAPAWEKAADTIERSYREVLTRGGLSQLLQWCKGIPSDVAERMPGFCVAAGWSLGWAGHRAEAESFLDTAEKGLGGAGAGESAGTTEADDVPGVTADSRALRGVIAISRAFILDLAGDTVRPLELARTADALLPATDYLGRSVIPYIVGKACRYRGELEKAEAAYGEFLRTAKTAGNIWSIAGATYETVQVYRLQGRLHDALALIDELDRLTEQFHARGRGPIAKTDAVKGELLREADRLDDALVIVEEAVRQVDTWKLPSDVYVSHQYLARVLRSRGEARRAVEELEKYHDLPRRAMVYTSLWPAFEADRLRTWLAAGALESAASWVKEYNPGKSQGPVNHEIEMIALARFRLATDASAADRHETVGLLEGLGRDARSGKRFGPLVEILVLRARAELGSGREEAAMHALGEALCLACAAGFFRVFSEEGPPIVELLARGLRAGAWEGLPVRAYAQSLLAAEKS